MSPPPQGALNRLGFTTFGDLTREKGVIEKRLAQEGVNDRNYGVACEILGYMDTIGSISQKVTMS